MKSQSGNNKLVGGDEKFAQVVSKKLIVQLIRIIETQGIMVGGCEKEKEKKMTMDLVLINRKC